MFNDIIEKLYVETDNKEIAKRINRAIENLKLEIKVKLSGIKSCEKGFCLSHYLSAVSKAKVELSTKKIKRPQQPLYSESDIEHPLLFQELKEWRTKKANKDDVPAFYIMHQKILIQIVIHLPENEEELRKIKGVGKQTIKKYGQDILEMVISYRKQNNIEQVILPEIDDTVIKESEKLSTVKKSKSSSNTKQVSFDMFNDGLSIAQIVKERGFVETTIQGHLGFFVENGKLHISKLVSVEKQKIITEKISWPSDNSLKEMKEQFDDKDSCSYGDIKLMISHFKYMETDS